MSPGRKRFQRNITELDALDFFDGMPGLKETVAQRVAARI
jgi:hypothetical protein